MKCFSRTLSNINKVLGVHAIQIVRSNSRMAAGAYKVSTHVRRDTDSEGHDKICHSQFDSTNWKWVSHLNDTDNRTAQHKHTHTHARF